MKLIRVKYYAIYSLFSLILSCKEIAQEANCRNFREAIVEDKYNANYVFTVEGDYNGEQLRFLTDRLKLIHLLQQREEVIDSLILNYGVVKLNDSTVNQVQVLRPQKNIDPILQSGKKKTIETYFDQDGWQRKGVLNYPEEINLINALTEWCVLVDQDDVSGYLRIEELDEIQK